MTPSVRIFGVCCVAISSLLLPRIACAQALPDPMNPNPSQPGKVNPLDPQSPAPKSPGLGRRPGELPGGGGRSPRQSAEDLVQVRCTADVDSITPGQTFHLAVIFDIEPGWHIYWKNPGASGGATDISVRGPHGFEVGQTLFPRPEAITGEEGTSYGYEGRVVLFVPVTPGADTAPESAMFSLNIDWLVCKEVCLKGHARSTIAVGAPDDIGGEDEEDGSAGDPKAIARQAFRHLPRPLSEAPSGSVTFDGSTLTITLAAIKHDHAALFPIETPGVTIGEDPEVTIENGIVTITAPITLRPGNSLGKSITIQGLVALGEADTDPAYEFSIPVHGPTEPTEAP